MRNKTELLNALKNFENAFTQLSNAWSEDGNDELMVIAQKECVDYPFSKSFDELTCEVSEWTYWMRKELGWKE